MTQKTRWRKSSRSASNAECVEIAHTGDAVRDSKNPNGPVLRVRSLAPLLDGIKNGRLG
jgi:hypothetical protein